MGNRAVITASTSKTEGIGIYVHWNGGLESILAFLKACEVRGFRTPDGDETYATARLCGLIHEFMGTWEDASLGIGTLQQLDTDNGDNGVYVIGPKWTLAKRWGGGSERRKTLASLDERERKQYDAILARLTVPLPKEAEE
jgi:hypothetical protein